MYNKKYRIDKIEEFNGHNPIYDGVEGRIAYPAYLNIGERGWFLYEEDEYGFWVHRIHTSVIKDIEYTRGNQIIVTTQNTKFTFTLIANN